MRYNEILLCVAKNHGRLVTVSATSPISGAFEVSGVVIAFSESKVRFALVDYPSLKELFDDLGHPQRLTIALKSIKHVRIHWALKYTEAVIDQQHNAFESDVTTLYPLLENTLKQTRLTTLDKLSTSTLLAFPQGRMVKTHLSIKHASGSIPVFSREKVFDIKTQSFIDGDWVIHYDQPLSSYFKYIPSIPDKNAFIRCAIDREKLDEIPRLLLLDMTMKRTDETRLKTWLNDAGNRPRKAFFNQLTVKNLGRKDYVIPFTEEHLDMREQQAVFTALKHPVTRLDTMVNKHRFFAHLRRAAILNDSAILIIDPECVLKDASNQAGVMSLLSHQDSIAALEQLNISMTNQPSALAPLAKDYDNLFNAVDEADKKTAIINYVNAHLKLAKNANDFQGIVNYESLYESLTRTLKPIAIKPLKNAIEPTSEREKQVNQKLNARRERLHGASYKKLVEVNHIDDAKQRLRTFRKLLKSPFHLHQIKHVFPVMLLKDTKALAYLKHAFDLVVFMRPSLTAVMDFHYADKVAVFNTSTSAKTPQFIGHNPYLFEYYQGNIFDVFEANDNDELKRIPLHSHNVGYIKLNAIDAKEESGHTSKVEAEAIMKRMKSHNDYHIHAPFVAQRKLLRTLVDGPIYNFYKPPLKPAFLSTSIHKNMAQKTYDWLKNHPHIIASLKHTMWPIEWLVDLEGLMQYSDGKDALFSMAKNALEATARGVDLLGEVTLDLWRADEVIFEQENSVLTLLRQGQFITRIKFIDAYHRMCVGNDTSKKTHYITGKCRASIRNMIQSDIQANRLRVKRTRDVYA